jgi:hypothetical protein
MISYKSILFGLMGGFLHAVIDSLLFLFTEEELKHYIMNRFKLLDKDETIMLISAVASGISILIANYVEHHYSKVYTFTKHPILDFIGIIMGVIFVIIIYEHFIKDMDIYKQKHKKNEQ